VSRSRHPLDRLSEAARSKVREAPRPRWAGPMLATLTDDENAHLPRNGVHWLTLRLVVEVGFTEWTDDGRLRHPRYLGIREDKDASEVVRERPG
jgi:ATP-dependent DNA ligase